MPRNKKLFIHGTMVEVSFRTEEGLPLVATPYMKLILEGIFARAQTLYPSSLCHFAVMANHLHLIFVIESPELIPEFVRYLKRESAHAVNHLLGRKKHTLWCDGYDSPVILDAKKAIERIVYLYSNPAKADLEESIEKYPNLNSWECFLQGGGEYTCKRISRGLIPALPRRSLSIKEQEEFARKLAEEAVEESTLYIEPDAWMECFKGQLDENPEVVNAEIIQRIRQAEESFSRKRSKPVIGAHALRLARMDQEYEPKKHGKRMICLSSFKEYRVRFISWFREHCVPTKKLTNGWSVSSWLSRIPPGLFAPGGYLSANINPAFVPMP